MLNKTIDTNDQAIKGSWNPSSILLGPCGFISQNGVNHLK